MSALGCNEKSKNYCHNTTVLVCPHELSLLLLFIFPMQLVTVWQWWSDFFCFVCTIGCLTFRFMWTLSTRRVTLAIVEFG